MFEPTASWSLPAHLFMVSGWSARCTRGDDPMSCVNDDELGGFQPPDHRAGAAAGRDGAGRCGPSRCLERTACRAGRRARPAWTDAARALALPSPRAAACGRATHVRNYAWTDLTCCCTAPRELALLRPRGCTVADANCAAARRAGSGIRCRRSRPSPRPTARQREGRPHFLAAARGGHLPDVSWVVPDETLSEHAPATPAAGQRYVTRLINAVMSGPDWNSTAIFLTWDDWGGFYDHVAPPTVDGNGYGMRVPGARDQPLRAARPRRPPGALASTRSTSSSRTTSWAASASTRGPTAVPTRAPTSARTPRSWATSRPTSTSRAGRAPPDPLPLDPAPGPRARRGPSRHDPSRERQGHERRLVEELRLLLPDVETFLDSDGDGCGDFAGPDRPDRLPRRARRHVPLADAVLSLARSATTATTSPTSTASTRGSARHGDFAELVRTARDRGHPRDRRPRREPHLRPAPVVPGRARRAATRPTATSTSGATRSRRRSRATSCSPTRRTRTGPATTRRGSGTCTASTRTSPT